MTLDEYNSFCASLPFATHVVQWGGAHVWKVGGKVFAIAGWSGGEELAVTFKCSEFAYEILREQPGCRPAPYLASRGMKWIQRRTGESMDAEALKDYIRESHGLIFRALPKRVKSELSQASDGVARPVAGR
ncbi:MAG TPA: MmcQ/YjbR family DNA-binding protein [Pseudaminobacter sp.]|jgi:predicted DNA-binding protein (MmcQ/YjbR family)|nr:MmcQ/YjbR family DNA-binding protein [Pseudaminobacter sp.]